jgi:hypothetical protein
VLHFPIKMEQKKIILYLSLAYIPNKEVTTVPLLYNSMQLCQQIR